LLPSQVNSGKYNFATDHKIFIGSNQKQIMQNKFIESIANMVLLLLLLMAAVSYNGKLFGRKAEDLFKSKEDAIEINIPTKKQLSELGLQNIQLQESAKGVWKTSSEEQSEKVINTKAFSKGIYGFGGQVPMLMHIDKENRIQNILLLENNETPDFIQSIQEKGIIKQWFGKNYSEAADLKPDVLSGATMTSTAINRSITSSLAAISNHKASINWLSVLDLKTIAALLVILLGIVVSFAFKGNKKLRTIQLILNTVILGLWCGKFISIKILLGWTSNGMNLLSSGIVFLMLILAVFMPLFFGKKAYYCTWICPLGSAQELAGKLKKKKWQPSKKAMGILKWSQTAITLSLFFCLWLGLAADIVDYEPFSAFIFQHASFAVLAIAIVSLVTAVFTPRPWCRFACPTGQVLNWTNKM
jgi:Na+-translocating ferredoxin:NAD+ oxidoreductase RnfG subunit